MIALIYCSLADLAAKYQWLAVAAGVLIGLPLLLAAISQRLVSLDSGDCSQGIDLRGLISVASVVIVFQLI